MTVLPLDASSTMAMREAHCILTAWFELKGNHIREQTRHFVVFLSAPCETVIGTTIGVLSSPSRTLAGRWMPAREYNYPTLKCCGHATEFTLTSEPCWIENNWMEVHRKLLIETSLYSRRRHMILSESFVRLSQSPTLIIGKKFQIKQFL